MSHIIKALSRVQHDHRNTHDEMSAASSSDHAESAHSVPETPKTFSPVIVSIICSIVLIIIGLYLNDRISSGMVLIKDQMVFMADSLKQQEEKFNELSAMVSRLENSDSTQRKEMNARLEKLSADVAGQLKAVNSDINIQQQQLVQSIGKQDQSIERLSSGYDQVRHSIAAYELINQNLANEINALKKKADESI